MRYLPTRLGPRLNISLLVFLLLLAAVTATIVVLGFRTSQDDATARSERGLETQARDSLRLIAGTQAYAGEQIVMQARHAGAQAASYIALLDDTGIEVPWDTARLVDSGRGHVHDRDVRRSSDVWFTGDLNGAVERDLRDSAALDALAPTLLAHSPDAVAMYFATANGVTRYYPPTGLSARVATDVLPGGPELARAAGPDANPSRGVYWSAPYEDAAGRGTLVTAYTPVYDGNEYRGAIAVDLSLERLIRQADTIRVTPGGYAFVIDSNGDLVRGRRYDLVAAAAEDPANGDFARVLASMRAGDHGVDAAILDGQEVFIGYAPLGGIGGSLALVAPKDEIVAQAAEVRGAIRSGGNRTVSFVLLALSGFFVVALASSAYLTRRSLVAPIEALVDGSRSVAAGDLSQEIPVRSHDELGVLAMSFNHMVAEIRQRNATLAESEKRYRDIFESTSDGMIVTSPGGHVLEANPAACTMHGYPYEEFVELDATDIIHPDYHRIREEFAERVGTGGIYTTRSVAVRKDGSTFPAQVWGRSFTYNGRPAILGIVRDITEQVQAEEVLEHRVEERTRELATLLEVSRDVASTLDLDRLIQAVLEQVRSVAEYDRAAFLVFDGEALNVMAINFPDPALRRQSRERPGVRFPAVRAPLWEMISRGEPVIIDDVRGEGRLAREYRGAVGELLADSPVQVRGWLGVPVMLKERMVGMLALAHQQPGFYNERHAELAQAIANQAAVALENARLFRETEQHARETEALLRADAELFRSLSLDEVFRAIVDVAVDVLQADKCLVATWDPDARRWHTRAARNIAEASLPHMVNVLVESTDGGPVVTLEPLVLEDVQGADQRLRLVFESEGVRSTLGVPIASAGGVHGAFGVAFTSPRPVTPGERRVFAALAERAAVAIDNAALYQRSQQVASLEERQKLARELHDSVSQALYGIALGARTARTLLDREPARAVEPVDYVLSLAQAGLSEMRALIFELRPESLETEGLVAALGKQVASTQARHGIEVAADLCAEPDAPIEAKEAVYRIAQEALHNVVKHARARRVDLRLACDDDGHIELDVRDDGDGFDPLGDFAGHLGLRSMRERAVRLGGTLRIESAPGEGSRVSLRLPLAADGSGDGL
jgi:PAS domain S-box-containing protein